MVKEQIRMYEELSMNAHPALNIMHYDGWILRFANGYSGRANSVNMLYSSVIPVLEKISVCQDVYQRYGLPVRFKMTDGMDDIDEILAEKGYEVVTPTTLMTLSTDRMAFRPAAAIVRAGIDEKWQKGYFSLVKIEAEHIDTARQIQGNILNKTLQAKVLNDAGEMIACGLCVIEKEYAGLFDIVVREDYRRQGYGYDLCTALIKEATDYGVRKVYLQVVSDNVKAVQMYQKIGFTPEYEYWYRVRENYSE